MTTSIAVTIAGSDSGGGAGIQADLKTFSACGVYGASAVVALTAQNTLGVRRVEAVGLEMVADQIDAVAEDLRPAAWKTGMLGTAEIIAVVVVALLGSVLAVAVPARRAASASVVAALRYE